MERYAMMALILFVPWTNMVDLVGEHTSWKACFDARLSPRFPARLKQILHHVELMHRCEADRDIDRKVRAAERSYDVGESMETLLYMSWEMTMTTNPTLIWTNWSR